MAESWGMTAPVDESIIDEAQRILATAVARSRAGEDRELTQKLKQGGEALASVLTGLLKLTRVHAADNHAFDAPTAELARAIAELVDLLGPVHLVTVEDHVYVNDVRLRSETLAALRDLGPDLARHNVGGITFHAALGVGAVRALIGAFAQTPAQTAPRSALYSALLAAGIKTVELTPRLRFLEQGEEELVRDPTETLHRTVQLVEETYANVAFGRVMNPLPLRRAITEILEIGPAVPAFWEALDDGLPHTAHAATVAMVSLLVGKAARLPTGFLHDLGLAALIHDIGYTGVAVDVAAGPEGLARHPGEGARLMLRQRGFHVAKLRRLRAVLDHHRDHDGARSAGSVLGDLLRIAEDYSTLLRVYRGRISPADALGAMLRAAGRLYHPMLMQVMVNALGRYPPGTLLELEDGRLVRSIAPVRSPETFALPLAREVDRATHEPSREQIDLAKASPIRRIVRGP